MSEHDNKYDVTELLDCRVFILDLDGTVYQETNHFAHYGKMLASYMDEETRAAYLRDVADALQGKHTLRYGDGYDVIHRMIVRNSQLLDWTGQTTLHHPSERVEYVDDPWGIYGNMAAYHGVDPDNIQQAFHDTRSHMESEAYPMTGMPGLRESIDSLRSQGVRFALATNSPEPDSRTILEKLGLTGSFEIEVFNAKKQVNAPTHFRRFQSEFGVPFAQMVSVGDHFRNEIRPAMELGMKTVCIDRYKQPERVGVSVVVHHPSELATVFSAVAKERSQRAR